MFGTFRACAVNLFERGRFFQGRFNHHIFSGVLSGEVYLSRLWMEGNS